MVDDHGGQISLLFNGWIMVVSLLVNDGFGGSFWSLLVVRSDGWIIDQVDRRPLDSGSLVSEC